MTPFEPNPEQQKVIETLTGDVVVSAGAGTGKTATLARRFARAVVEGPVGGAPLTMDEVLAMTFTRKAAAELRERVRRVLATEEGQVALARRVDESWVSTIDGFCGRILRRHALEAGIDPGFGIASEVQSGAMRAEAMDAVLAAARRSRTAAAELVDAYGDDIVRTALGKAHDRVRTMGLGPADLEVGVGEPMEVAAAGLSIAMAEFAEGIRAVGLDCPTRIDNLEACDAGERLLAAALRQDPAERGAAVLEAVGSLRFDAGAKPKDLAGAAKAARETLLVAAVGEVTAPLMAAFRELLSAFDDAYASAKRTAGLLDHADVEIATMRLFETRPDVAKRYREGFRLLMIDEFQDTNELQMRVFSHLRDDDLCVVGDDKQSIYGFRYAEVEILEGLKREVEQQRPLTENYRSRPEVLGLVNRVFGDPRMFGGALQPLRASRPPGPPERWPDGMPQVEVLAIDRATVGVLDRHEAEAATVAGRIAELIEAGVPASDVVVLLRAMGPAPRYAEAIRAHGIDVHLGSGELFFESRAVGDLRALLKVLIVPEDGEALVRVLAGPLVRVSDDALLAVGAGRERHASLWDGLADAAAGRVPGVGAHDRTTLASFLETTEHLRRAMSRVSVADLLRDACAAFDHDLTLLSCGAEGHREWRNTLKLVRLAAEWESATRGDVGAFLTYLEACAEHASKDPTAPLAAAGDSARVMSVHSVKGLEFPVVFYSDTGRTMAGAETDRLTVARIAGRPLLVCRHPDDGSASEDLDGPRYDEVQREVLDRALAEEERLAYVACTRAREALFITGMTGAKGGVPDGKSYLGAFHAALGSPASGDLVDTGEGMAVRWTVVDVGSPEAREGGLPLPSRASPADVGAPTPVPAPGDTCPEPPGGPALPESLSFTELKEYETCPLSFYAKRVLRLARLADPSRRATGVGSAVHAVLEQGDDTPEGASAAAERFGLEPHEAQRVKEAVAAFRATPTAAELAAADRVHREQPFSVPLAGVRLVGSVDAIGWRDHHALVVDYKTGRDAEVSLGDERRRSYELQAACYAAAAFAAGAETVAVRFVFPELDGATVEHDFSESDREAVSAMLEAKAEPITVGEYRPLPGYAEGACRDCPALGGLCPVDAPPRRAGV